MTDGIITALLARVDNSVAEAMPMPANLAFYTPGRSRPLSCQKEASTAELCIHPSARRWEEKICPHARGDT